MLIKFLNLKQNMLRLHVMNSIEGLGWSLIGIFIPIFFLKLGFSLPQVFVYYIIQNSVICLGAFLVIFLEKFISIKKIFIIRFPILLLFLGILYYLQDINFPLERGLIFIKNIENFLRQRFLAISAKK